MTHNKKELPHIRVIKWIDAIAKDIIYIGEAVAIPLTKIIKRGDKNKTNTNK